MQTSAVSGFAVVLIGGLAALLLPCETVTAATLRLNDGTVIQGEIESLRGDVYTVKSESLGTVRVRKEDIRAIDMSDSPEAESAPSPSAFQSLQQQLLQSQKVMAMIQALQSDPEIQAVMSDPEILTAISSGDYAALMNHPKIMALTDNANLREIIEAAQ
jgi:hypothetical protein